MCKLNNKEILQKVKERQQIEQEILNSEKFHGSNERQGGQIWAYETVIHLIEYGDFEMTKEEI